VCVWTADVGPLGKGPTGGAVARLDPATTAEATKATTTEAVMVGCLLAILCSPLWSVDGGSEPTMLRAGRRGAAAGGPIEVVPARQAVSTVATQEV